MTESKGSTRDVIIVLNKVRPSDGPWGTVHHSFVRIAFDVDTSHGAAAQRGMDRLRASKVQRHGGPEVKAEPKPDLKPDSFTGTGDDSMSSGEVMTRLLAVDRCANQEFESTGDLIRTCYKALTHVSFMLACLKMEAKATPADASDAIMLAVTADLNERVADANIERNRMKHELEELKRNFSKLEEERNRLAYEIEELKEDSDIDQVEVLSAELQDLLTQSSTLIKEADAARIILGAVLRHDPDYVEGDDVTKITHTLPTQAKAAVDCITTMNEERKELEGELTDLESKLRSLEILVKPAEDSIEDAVYWKVASEAMGVCWTSSSILGFQCLYVDDGKIAAQVVAGVDGGWLWYTYRPGEYDVRHREGKEPTEAAAKRAASKALVAHHLDGIDLVSVAMAKPTTEAPKGDAEGKAHAALKKVADFLQGQDLGYGLSEDTQLDLAALIKEGGVELPLPGVSANAKANHSVKATTTNVEAWRQAERDWEAFCAQNNMTDWQSVESSEGQIRHCSYPEGPALKVGSSSGGRYRWHFYSRDRKNFAAGFAHTVEDAKKAAVEAMKDHLHAIEWNADREAKRNKATHGPVLVDVDESKSQKPPIPKATGDDEKAARRYELLFDDGFTCTNLTYGQLCDLCRTDRLTQAVINDMLWPGRTAHVATRNYPRPGPNASVVRLPDETESTETGIHPMEAERAAGYAARRYSRPSYIGNDGNVKVTVMTEATLRSELDGYADKPLTGGDVAETRTMGIGETRTLRLNIPNNLNGLPDRPIGTYHDVTRVEDGTEIGIYSSYPREFPSGKPCLHYPDTMAKATLGSIPRPKKEEEDPSHNDAKKARRYSRPFVSDDGKIRASVMTEYALECLLKKGAPLPVFSHVGMSKFLPLRFHNYMNDINIGDHVITRVPDGIEPDVYECVSITLEDGTFIQHYPGERTMYPPRERR